MSESPDTAESVQSDAVALDRVSPEEAKAAIAAEEQPELVGQAEVEVLPPEGPQPWRECVACENDPERVDDCQVCKGRGGFGQTKAEIALKQKLAVAQRGVNELTQNLQAAHNEIEDLRQQLGAYYEAYGPMDD